ncbi:cystatin-A1-like [Centropristis striata]|uniref:cystatin-A1-like n=1 Tax=Centropristis striata TaxID=184440 RepID=UPI0027E02863|nr:cystatin-A1-like [Centropristis striata]
MANIVHVECRVVREDVDEEIQRICDKVKGPVEEFTGKTYEVYKAVKYRSHPPLGNGNFLIKVFVGVEDYIHLSVHEVRTLVLGMPRPIEMLQGVEQRRTKDDPLVSFVNTFKWSSSTATE